MVEADRPRFAVAISAMLETFGQEATKQRLMGYWLGLRDISIELVEEAVGKALQTATRLPVPADVRSLCSGGDASDRAIAAWSDVQKSATVSYMADLDFSDYVINAVIRNLGGRTAFFDRLNAGTESEKWLRLDFLKVYATYADRLPSEEMTRPLIGEAMRDEVCGRSGKPRLFVIHADQDRIKALPLRQVELIESKQPLRLCEFKKV
jgi:hypothetical protein